MARSSFRRFSSLESARMWLMDVVISFLPSPLRTLVLWRYIITQLKNQNRENQDRDAWLGEVSADLEALTIKDVAHGVVVWFLPSPPSYFSPVDGGIYYPIDK